MEHFDRNLFYARLARAGIELNAHQMAQFDQYATLLKQWNEKINLTAITETDAIYEKHFYDSLLPFLHREVHCLCDVGAGAGFPSLPVKIVFPQVKVIILEPLAKRIKFLETVCDTLGLDDVTCLHERAEDHAKVHREAYETVSARAVANLPMLSELCLPLVQVGGTFIAMKGAQGEQEALDAQNAIEKLGAELTAQEQVRLSDGSMRINLMYQKVKPTPKIYPRPFAQIKKRPL